MSVTPPDDPDRDGHAAPAGAGYHCPACGRLRVRVDRPGNRVRYVCVECEPDALPRDLLTLGAS